VTHLRRHPASGSCARHVFVQHRPSASFVRGLPSATRGNGK
jgi:hypothetical protein